MKVSPHTFRKLLSLLLLLTWASNIFSQQRISGTVTDSLGHPLFKANITEIDKNHRIVNQTTTDHRGNFVMAVRDTLTGHLRISANGYVTQRDRIRRNQQVLRVSLEKRKASRLSTLMAKNTNKKSKAIRSKKLFCGRNGAHEEPWMVMVERLSDSIYVLQIPVKAQNMAGNYKEGRTMSFLDLNDYQIITVYNGEDAIPIEGNPDSYDPRDHNEMQRIGNFKLHNGFEEYTTDNPIYFYPQFILTLDDIQILLAQADRLSRIAVDTEAADNFWLVYPMDTFHKELTKIIDKLNKQ